MKTKKMEWKYELGSSDDVPSNGLVAISIRDNVLDDENYPIHGLFLKAGAIVEQFRMDEDRDVAYGLPCMIGKTSAHLTAWVNKNEDNDPNYFPETWNVVAIMS